MKTVRQIADSLGKSKQHIQRIINALNIEPEKTQKNTRYYSEEAASLIVDVSNEKLLIDEAIEMIRAGALEPTAVDNEAATGECKVTELDTGATAVDTEPTENDNEPQNDEATADDTTTEEENKELTAGEFGFETGDFLPTNEVTADDRNLTDFINFLKKQIEEKDAQLKEKDAQISDLLKKMDHKDAELVQLENNYNTMAMGLLNLKQNQLPETIEVTAKVKETFFQRLKYLFKG